VTAYSLTRPEERDRENGVVVDVLSKAELLAENERLHALVAETRLARDAWHDAWTTAVERRIADRERLTRSMRVLASLARLAPGMPALIEAARREIWRLDE
jgi:hypothetical protein